MTRKTDTMLARRMRVSTAMLALAAALSLGAVAVTAVPAMATQIRYVVNDRPVTSYDIERRAALLRLMRRSGNINELAAQEMIDQVLRRQEMARLGINITDAQVDQSYANFASSNQLSVAQLDQILAQSGVTKEHFKEFIRTQMGWSRVLQARNSRVETLSEAEVVRRMLQQGGQKRKREAQAMRDRFNGCESTVEFAKGLIDVTVKDLGRVLAPELPPDWKDYITKTRPGEATPVRETDRGVEFIGVCSAREVSDDHVAKLVFQSQESGDSSYQNLSEEYTAELRQKARIHRR
jgi:peptidyl-prolyl cis-trans isomerase SurA